MKKLNLYILTAIAIILTLPTSIQAQQVNYDALTTENTKVVREKEKVVLSTNIRTDHLELGSQDMIQITPVLLSADSTNFYQFAPVIIAGGTRYKVLRRGVDLGNIKFEHQPQMIVKHKKHHQQTIPLTMTVDYQEWMNNSRFVFYENLRGCACENEGSNKYVVLVPALPVQYNPVFAVAYITPPVEEVKQRSETYTAHINFEVDKHVILPNYKNNAEVLKKVDEIINEIRNDANLKVTQFQITGYASPEGNAQSNLILSQHRAEAFVLYLMNKYKIILSEIRTDWKGEDWEGLRKVVAESNIPDRHNVLNILDNESNVVTRKNKLKQLSGGTTYKMMLNEYYPPLRRNDYTISFTVKGFDLDEAKEMIRTKPQYLSQHEMYLVANSYPKNSAAYKEAFNIIEKYFPNDEVALLNNSAAELENGATDEIISKLQKINKPEAWNNLGIAYFKKKDYKKAEEYFSKASQAGLLSGTSNLEQLTKFTKGTVY